MLSLCLVGPAPAETLIEAFEEPFLDWESGWLAENSNLQNHYGVGRDRGNNPDGLWINDGDGLRGGDFVEIAFDPEFGAKLTSFSIDVAGWVPARIQVFDMSRGLLLDEQITLTRGAYTDPGDYVNYAVESFNGISSFAFSPIDGSQVEGNTGIDNVTVTLIPEPATAALTGLACLAATPWRRRLS